MLVNSQQFERNNNKLRAIIQAFLNTNKTWIVHDFRETVPMDVDHTSQSKGKSGRNGRTRAKERARITTNARAKTRATAKAKAVENLTTTKNVTCAEKGAFRTRLLVTSKP